MANISYIKVLQTIESFASAHIQIKKFGSDFPSQMPNFSTTDEAYPILFVSPTNSIFNQNTTTFTIDVYCFDIIQKDRENINTILSDTNSILSDLEKWFRDGDIYGIDIISSSSVNPINNALLDYAAGWVMTLTLDVNTYGVCEIPFNESPIVISEVCDITYAPYLTCGTLPDCSTIQTIQSDIAALSAATDANTFTTGFTYSENVFTISDNAGNNLSATINTMTGLTVNGSISATTYLGIPTQEQYWTSGSSGTYSIKVNNGSILDATGNYSVAEGFETTAAGDYSHAEGYQTIAQATYSHAEGGSTITTGDFSHAEGQLTTASGNYSHSEGDTTLASGDASHAEGEQTLAQGTASHAEGFVTSAIGNFSHSEGSLTTASGEYSHAEGNTTTASGLVSHSEGINTISSGNYSHSEGATTTASGAQSHAEGSGTKALGSSSHSEGQYTQAVGVYSHAGGVSSIASGQTSFVHGSGSTAGGIGTIVLGSGITGLTDNTTYVNKLNIKLIGSGTSITSLGVDSSGNVVSGSTGSSSGIWGIANSAGTYTYYSTIYLALTASVAGQTIEMFADVTSATATAIILKNGVNINGNGHTLTLTDTTVDGLVDTGANINCDISNITIIKSGNNMVALYLTNASTVTGNARISNTTNGGIGVYAYYYGKVIGLFCSGSYPVLLYNNSVAQNVTVYACSYGTAINAENFSRVIACSINSTSTAGISALYVRSDSSAVGCSVYANGQMGAYLSVRGEVKNCYIKSLTHDGVNMLAGTMLYNSTIDSSGGYGVDASSGGDIKGNIISSMAQQALNLGGDYPIYNNILKSSAAECVLLYGRLYGCTLINTWNNAGGHGVKNPTTTSKIVGCTFDLVNSSAYAIYSSGAPTIVYSKNKVIGSVNMASAGIVQGQSSTEDTFGNIVIN